jgi:hypothetical protein
LLIVDSLLIADSRFVDWASTNQHSTITNQQRIANQRSRNQQWLAIPSVGALREMAGAQQLLEHAIADGEIET